ATPADDPIQYGSEFSAMNPLGEDGDLSIHPTTGVITYTGHKKGSYMVTVCIQQYKSGQLVGSVLREIELNFVECSDKDLRADFDYKIDFCTPGRLMFENKSEHATSLECSNYTDENTRSTPIRLNTVMTFTS